MISQTTPSPPLVEYHLIVHLLYITEQKMDVEEEESLEWKYQQPAELSSSTIQLLEEQSEKMKEETESLMALQLHQPTTKETHQERVNGDVRGVKIVTSEADTLTTPIQTDGIK